MKTLYRSSKDCSVTTELNKSDKNCGVFKLRSFCLQKNQKNFKKLQKFPNIDSHIYKAGKKLTKKRTGGDKIKVKKLLKMIKRKIKIIVLFALILFFIAGVAAICALSFKYIPKARNPNELIITACVGGLTFVGTFALGIIAYWQTIASYDLSMHLAKKDMSTYITPGRYAGFRLDNKNLKDLLSFAEKYPAEFLICSEKTKDEVLNSDLNREQQVLYITLELLVENAPVDKLHLTGFGFNTTLISKDLECCRKTYNILNDNRQFSVIFNPQTKNYLLEICIDIENDMEYFKMINDESMLVIDMEITSESINGLKTSQRISLNLKKLPGYNLFLTGIPQYKKIENTTIHIGEEIL